MHGGIGGSKTVRSSEELTVARTFHQHKGANTFLNVLYVIEKEYYAANGTCIIEHVHWTTSSGVVERYLVVKFLYPVGY
jgi:hypothetical protein